MEQWRSCRCHPKLPKGTRSYATDTEHSGRFATQEASSPPDKTSLSTTTTATAPHQAHALARRRGALITDHPTRRSPRPFAHGQPLPLRTLHGRPDHRCLDDPGTEERCAARSSLAPRCGPPRRSRVLGPSPAAPSAPRTRLIITRLVNRVPFCSLARSTRPRGSTPTPVLHRRPAPHRHNHDPPRR